MSQRLHAVIEEAEKLSPMEQLELISTLSRSLWLGYQELELGDDFWQPQSIEALVTAQQTNRISDVKDLVADFWPEEESADDIIDHIYTQRHQDSERD